MKYVRINPSKPERGLAQLVDVLDARDIGAVITMLIERLDERDGDPDLEEIGAEDSFEAHPSDGPGCPIADTDYCTASDDRGTRARVGSWGICDDLPGDPEDAEDGGDLEYDAPAIRRIHRDRIRRTRCHAVPLHGFGWQKTLHRLMDARA